MYVRAYEKKILNGFKEKKKDKTYNLIYTRLGVTYNTYNDINDDDTSEYIPKDEMLTHIDNVGINLSKNTDVDLLYALRNKIREYFYIMANDVENNVEEFISTHTSEKGRTFVNVSGTPYNNAFLDRDVATHTYAKNFLRQFIKSKKITPELAKISNTDGTLFLIPKEDMSEFSKFVTSHVKYGAAKDLILKEPLFLANKDLFEVTMAYFKNKVDLQTLTLKPTDFRDTRTSGTKPPTCAIGVRL